MKSPQTLTPTSILLLRLWRHLGRRRQRQFVLLLPLMFLSAFTEMLSLGAVLPFLGVLANPDQLFENPLVARFATSIGVSSADQLVLPLTMVFAASSVLAGMARMTVLWFSTRLAFATGADLSLDVYRRTLYQPYQVHVARNSSEVISGISGKVGAATNSIYQVLVLISSVVLMCSVMAAVLAINPSVAILAAIGFGGCYASITWLSRRWLRRNSRKIAEQQTQLVKALQEGLGGIRDVLLDGTQPYFCDIYRKAVQTLRIAQAGNAFITSSPRFAMEALGMALIAFLAYSISGQSGGVSATLPTLGALALAAQRMLPALQQSYSAWATIAGGHDSLADALNLLDQPLSSEALLPAPPQLEITSAICLDSVHFRYSKEGPWILSDFNLKIPRGVRVGLVGKTGGGKSTALDLIMALLTPTAGALIVDGQKIFGSRARAWQRSIAHVPQSIYLADASLAENIAFGVPRELIDLARVHFVARQAHIADFIESSPVGYDALVGERGIRLSGGQRQRIGIARALYKRASVLVFDEATSALDNATEQSVMDAIDGLDRSLTILLVAHRLSTVRRCEFLVEIDNGRVIAQGTYEQLMEQSASFRRMAKGVA